VVYKETIPCSGWSHSYCSDLPILKLKTKVTGRIFVKGQCPLKRSTRLEEIANIVKFHARLSGSPISNCQNNVVDPSFLEDVIDFVLRKSSYVFRIDLKKHNFFKTRIIFNRRQIYLKYLVSKSKTSKGCRATLYNEANKYPLVNRLHSDPNLSWSIFAENHLIWTKFLKTKYFFLACLNKKQNNLGVWYQHKILLTILNQNTPKFFRRLLQILISVVLVPP